MGCGVADWELEQKSHQFHVGHAILKYAFLGENSQDVKGVL